MAMTPGWYPDPFSSTGYVRWWDGDRWGASVMLPEGMDAPAPGQAAPLPPPGSTGQASSAAATPVAPSAPSAPSAWAPPPPPGSRAGAPYGAAWPAAAAPFELATWGSRAAARIIDTLIETVIIAPFAIWLLWPAIVRLTEAMPSDGTMPSEQVLQSWVNDVTGLSLVLTLVSAVITFLYEVPANRRWGQTLGKRVVGLRIRPRDEDRQLGWGQATVRWGVYTAGVAVIGGLFAVLDYLWPLWDKPWRQAIHDKAARTVVVPHRR